MSTKIMIQLHKKYNNPTKKDFDQAIAQLFTNASRDVFDLAKSGKNHSYDFDFWHIPKVGTIFENLSDNTTYRLAVKVLEARDRWLARRGASQAPSHEGETVKAVDIFKGNVEVAALASGGMAALLSGNFNETIDFTMNSYMIDQFEELSDTESEDLSDDEGPARPRAAKRPKLESAGTTDVDMEGPAAKRVKTDKAGTTGGDVGFDPALVSGTARLALGGGAPEGSGGAKENIMYGTGDFDAFLAKLALEDQAQLDEEDMMEMNGN